MLRAYRGCIAPERSLQYAIANTTADRDIFHPEATLRFGGDGGFAMDHRARLALLARAKPRPEQETAITFWTELFFIENGSVAIVRQVEALWDKAEREKRPAPVKGRAR